VLQLVADAGRRRGATPRAVAVADVNNDGFLDAITAFGAAGSGGLFVHPGNGDGTFRQTGVAQPFTASGFGFCPSCGARRMAQTAAHLVDHVIPHVPVRQWVLSLPIPLRVLLAAQPELVTSVLQVVHRVITRHLLGQAGLQADEADSGAVTLIQRFGSAANLMVQPQYPRCASD
jgi:hypothetical protein